MLSPYEQIYCIVHVVTIVWFANWYCIILMQIWRLLISINWISSRNGRHLKNQLIWQSGMGRLTTIHLSLIFGFYKCLPFCVCLAYRFLKRKCSSIIWTNKHVHACSSHYNSVICQYNCHSADRQQIQELLTHTVNTVYLINWVQSPYGGKLVKLDLFTCLYGSVHTREKKMRPIFPDTGQVWGQMIYYMAIYQSELFQEETTAVQCTHKYTMWANSDWLSFSQAKLWLDGKLTSKITWRNSNETALTLLRLQRLQKFEWKGY